MDDRQVVVASSPLLSPLLLLLPWGGALPLLSPLELLNAVPFVEVALLSEVALLFGWDSTTGRDGRLAEGDAGEACSWLKRPTASPELSKPGPPLLLYLLIFGLELLLLLSPPLRPGAKLSGLLCRLEKAFVVVSTNGGVA